MLAGASCMSLAAAVTSTATAHADPSWTQNITAGGSDTIQDLFDCYAGLAQGTNGPNCDTNGKLNYANAAVADGVQGVNSWDAIVPTPAGQGQGAQWSAYTPTLGAPSIDRENGSGAGRTALEDSLTATGWSECNVSGGVSTTNPACASPPSATQAPSTVGEIDVARSSSVGSHFGVAGDTNLSYIPIATDAVAYAYYCPTTSTTTSGNDCAALGHLTVAQLKALYDGTHGGVLTPTGGGLAHDTVSACSLQTGSGTYQFWGAEIGDGTSQATLLSNVSTDACQNAADGGNTAGLEENNLNIFASTVTGGSFPTGSDWIVPVSVGQVVGQHNGYGKDRVSTGLATGGIGIGVPDTDAATLALTEPFDCGSPLANCANSTTAGTWAPDHTYYGDQFGRYLFAVAATSVLSGLHANRPLVAFFDSGATSQVCTAAGTAVSALFGFDQQYSNTDGLTGESGGSCGTVLGTSNN